VDEFGLVQAFNGLGQGIVVAVATLPTEGSTPASARSSVYLMDTDCLPRPEWWTNPRPGRRWCRACSRASSTKLAWTVRLTRQAKTSMTKPYQVET
jgi:uncharacterized protein (DUF2237 family)